MSKHIEELEQRCSAAEEALDAIRHGAIDALVITGEEGEKIYTIQGAETPYRLLVEAINEGAATLIEDGTILYCNRRFAEMIGIPLEELIGSSIYKYISPEDRTDFSSLLLQGLKEECRNEINLLIKGDGHIPVMASLNSFSAYGGTGVCLIASDLTEQKKVEELTLQEALRAEALSEFSRSLVEASLDEQAILNVAVYSTAHLVGDACLIRLLSPGNQSLNIAAHYYPVAGVDHLIAQFLSQLPLRADEGLSGQVLQTGQAIMLDSLDPAQLTTIYNSELVEFYKKLNATSLMVVPLRTQEKNIGTMLLAKISKDQPYQRGDFLLANRLASQIALALANSRLHKDLQDALHMEQNMRLQLIQAEKLSALNRMMATVVHEINNPVQTIKNCIYLATADMPPTTPQHKYLDMATSEIDRITKLVSTLRNIYRQPKSITIEKLDLSNILQEVHMLLEPHLQHQKITWRQEVSDMPLWVNATADHLKQVFLNLSLNAVEAMQPGGGTITISTISDTDKNSVAVTIKDTGPGIESEYLEKIFEPFYTTKEGGSGLGLPICNEIIQQHSGRITVDSELGKGAAFTVWLPLIPLVVE